MDKKKTIQVRVTPYLRDLMELVRKKVAVDTHGDIVSREQAMRYVLENYLEEDEK